MSYRELVFNLGDVLQRQAVARAVDENIDFLLIYTLQFPLTLPRYGRPGLTVTVLNDDGTLNRDWYEAFMLRILYSDPTEAVFPGASALNIVRYYVTKRNFDIEQIQVLLNVQNAREKQQAFARLTGRSRLIVLGHCCDDQNRLYSDIPLVLVAAGAVPNPPVAPGDLAGQVLAGAPHLARAGEPLAVQLWACNAANSYCGELIAELYRRGIIAVITCSDTIVPRLTLFSSYTERERIIEEETCGVGRYVFYLSVEAGKPVFKVYQFR